MKRTTTCIIALLLTMTTAWAQPEEKPTVLIPGKGHIDVEKLEKNIDLQMDISNLSLSELRVLRNALAAQRGYIFMSADLRDLFSATSWYNQKMMERFDKLEELSAELLKDDNYQQAYNEAEKRMPMRYTAAEMAFIKKLQAREQALKARNFSDDAKRHPNTTNIINPYQLEDGLMPALTTALGRQGFAIVPSQADQLFHIYEKNDYHDFPSFVTTDLFLQLYHLYFDCLLRETEQHRLLPVMTDFCRKFHAAMTAAAQKAETPEMRDAAEYGAAFFAVAVKLASPKDPMPAVPARYKALAETELANVTTAKDITSDLFNTSPYSFPYSLFRPRGHYTRSESLKQYFRAMMWLQTAPMSSHLTTHLQRAALMARIIELQPSLIQAYKQLTEPITYLMGAPDNITILQVWEVMQSLDITTDRQLSDKKNLQQLARRLEAVANVQTRIKPKDMLPQDQDGRCTINLMPQRYQPDAEVLQEMVDYKTKPSLRKAPKGLDLMAAMGWSAAEQILTTEIGEGRQWTAYPEQLAKMKQRMGEIDWSQTLTNRWLKTLSTLSQQHPKQPYFMQNAQWQKKSLNAALASWAELKHDAILYAKQPMGAECGAGGPPDPITKGYVEPNEAFWKAVIQLTNDTQKALVRFGLNTEKSERMTEQLRELAIFLQGVVRKELYGGKITDEEYSKIAIVGSDCEYMSLQLLQEGDQEVYNWTDVQGTDKKVSLVADVFTASSRNVPDPEKTILYEAVGPAYEIYVVVPIDGYLYLTRGAVLSYREFQRAMIEPRWTDEEWQQQLEKQPRAGEPQWMEEIIVPVKVEDNETYFYSSGC